MEILVQRQWQNPAQQTENVEENEPLFVAEHTEATLRSQVRKIGKAAYQARRKHRDGPAPKWPVSCRRVAAPQPCRDVTMRSFHGTRQRSCPFAANPKSPPPVLCSPRNQARSRPPCATLCALAGHRGFRPSIAAPQ